MRLSNNGGELMQRNKFTIAGGSFADLFRIYADFSGIEHIRAGYIDGTSMNPTYQQVHEGRTDYYMAIEITYDASQLSIGVLLDLYWTNIDPTDPSGQFENRGSCYSTAIFYHDDEQLRQAVVDCTSIGFLENNTIALLTSRAFISDYSYSDSLINLKRAIEFGINKVIIDFRDNNGGELGYLDELFRSMDIDPGRYGFLINFSSTIVAKLDAYRWRSGSSAIEPLNIFTNKHNLEVVVLTNGLTAKAASLGATLVHDTGLGTVIGTEPRSPATQYGLPIRSRLTHSSFPYNISHVKFTRPNQELDAYNAGIVDIVIPESEDALAKAIAYLQTK